MNIPFYEELKALVTEGGFDAYLVGGCVRDVLLDRTVSDIDMVCFSHDYKDFAQAVRILLPSAWVEFKDNVRLVCPNLEIDVSKPRGATIEEDIQKRDFTINNLAMDFSGKIIGDSRDIMEKRIRHVSETSFTDDPLRLLRAFRFASQLGFAIDGETMTKIKAERALISQSASERILAELTKMAEGGYAAQAFSAMRESGLSAEIFGKDIVNCPLVEAAKLGRGLNFILSAMIYADSSSGILVKRLNLSNAASRRVVRTAEAAVLLKSCYDSNDKSEQRRLIYAYPEEIQDALEIYLLACGCDGKDRWQVETFVHNVMIEMKYVDFETPMRLNGGFLMNMGISAGRTMGAILAQVRPLIASGEIDGLEEAEKYIKENYL